jgi:hypothetical protein
MERAALDFPSFDSATTSFFDLERVLFFLTFFCDATLSICVINGKVGVVLDLSKDIGMQLLSSALKEHIPLEGSATKRSICLEDLVGLDEAAVSARGWSKSITIIHSRVILQMMTNNFSEISYEWPGRKWRGRLSSHKQNRNPPPKLLSC